MIYLSADVGGTFTDLVLIDSDAGRSFVEKLPSAARGRADSIADGVRLITQLAGRSPADIDLFVHGFTVATNAFLMRKGARVALLVSKGFRDILEIRDQRRPKLYALRQQVPRPLAARADVIEVDERLDAFGGTATPLTEQEISRVVERAMALAVDSIAICLQFSYLNDRHERALEDALRVASPQIPVYRSSSVDPRIEEYPRANTTALAAYVGPIVDRYLSDVESHLARTKVTCPLRLMRSDGGVATPQAARANPAHMMLSGPAGGVIAGRALGARLCRRDIVTFDMGGTSADFAIIDGGEPRTVRERIIDGQPLRLPTLDIETISAGGGSIAWVDHAGALKVGPDSAGAVPGPACYAQGGRAPTITDAAVVLGILDPARYLGGRIQLDSDLATAAVREQISKPMGLSLEEAAAGIISIASVQMIQAIRTLSVERGLDARRFSLLAFGGAGPLFAPYLAAGLEMREVLVPPHPGVFCAEGLLLTDIRHTTQCAYRRALMHPDAGEMAAQVERLRSQLDQSLTADGIASSARRFMLFGDLRYVGQFHELELPLPFPDESGAWRDADIRRRFHETHDAAYGHSDSSSTIELVNLRLVALGRIERPPPPAAGAETPYEPKPFDERPAYLQRRGGFASCRHFDRSHLRPGAQIRGPALIHQLDSTVLVLMGHRARALSDGTLAIAPEDEP